MVKSLARFGFHSDIPGPAPLPILGWLPQIIQLAFRPLSTLEALQRRYGNLIRLGHGKSPAILIFDPVLNRQVLRDPAVFYSYDLERSPIPIPQNTSMSRLITGMPFTNGARHDAHRAHMLPSFHKKFITRYHEACVQVAERKADSWKPGQVVDMRAEMEQLAIWLVTRPVLGMDPEQEGERVGRQLEETVKLLFSPLALLFPHDWPGTPFRRLRQSGDRMERLVREIIAQRRVGGIGWRRPALDDDQTA